MQRQINIIFLYAYFQIVHTVEECSETLAFASEPVLASLGNVLAAEEQRHAAAMASVNHHHPHQHPPAQPAGRPTFIKEYHMLDIEIKYGLLQCIEALSFLHCNCHYMHRNVCPSSIIITKKGTWKLFGFEFLGKYKYISPTV